MDDSKTDSSPTVAKHDDLTQLFKDPDGTSQEVVRAVFDLKHIETRTYRVLLEHPHSSAKELAKELDRHRRHVSRALRGLHDAGLVERYQEPIEAGGRGHFYEPVPAEDAKQYLQNQLDKWVAHLRREIRDFDENIEADAVSESESSCHSDGGRY